MNNQQHIYAIILNAFAAILVAFLMTGEPLAVVFAHFAPLPLMVAGLILPWIYSAAASLLIGLAFLIISPALGIYYMVMVAIPSIAATYIAGLNEQFTVKVQEKENTLISKTFNVIHWTPIGTILFMLAIYCATAAVVFVAMFGGSLDGFVEKLAPVMQQIQAMPDLPAQLQTMLESESARRIVILALPVGGAAIWYISLMVMLYGAGRMANSFKLLPRHWPDLANELVLPTEAAIAAAIALLLSFMAEPIGYMAEFFSATLLILWAASGLAVIHFFARQTSHATFLLAIFYLALLFMGWLLVAVALVGVFEALFQWRDKFRATLHPNLKP